MKRGHRIPLSGKIKTLGAPLGAEPPSEYAEAEAKVHNVTTPATACKARRAISSCQAVIKKLFL